MKKYMPLLPSAMYSYMFAIGSVVIAKTKESDMWDTIFFDGMIPIMFIAGLVCNLIVMTKAIKEKWDARELLKVNLILKWVQFPANVCFFPLYFMIIYVLFELTAFFSGGEAGSFKSLMECFVVIFLSVVIFILVLNLAGVLFSAFIAMAAIVRAKSEGLITKRMAVFCGICSCLVVFDVVTAQILYRKGKRENG